MNSGKQVTIHLDDAVIEVEFKNGLPFVRIHMSNQQYPHPFAVDCRGFDSMAEGVAIAVTEAYTTEENAKVEYNAAYDTIFNMLTKNI